MQYGYCTNIHSGSDFQSVCANLEQYSVAVREQIGSTDALNVGLWLSNEVTMEVTEKKLGRTFSDWLAERHLLPFTLNVFPFDNFHQPVVKHNVYCPTWADDERRDYTIASAHLLDQILPGSEPGTLSTLPLGWPTDTGQDQFMQRCAENLRHAVNALADLESSGGRQLLICLEPEPGCVLQYSRDVADFFERYLLTGNAPQDNRTRRHLGICHDICHAAVMFETQDQALATYQQSDITIGKIQVSSAVESRFADASMTGSTESLIQELERFVEPRYLHQTVALSGDGSSRFFEDLPDALAFARSSPEILAESKLWRTHFHVPIYLESLAGGVSTTQNQINQCVDWMKRYGKDVPWEIETYAWNVSPSSVKKQSSMIDTIANELKWFQQFIQ